MSRKILMFEMNSLADALAVDRVAAAFDAEVVPVPRKHYNKTLEDLVDPWSEIYDEDAETEDYTGGALGGRMMVLCELEDQLEAMIPALSAAGAGSACLKAVLTPSNRSWDPVRLYRELQRERQAMSGK